MFIVTHAVIGAIIGEKIGNPLAAALVGFVFHFISDMIPHGDSRVYKNFKEGNFVKKAVAFVTVDSLAAVFFVLLLFNLRDFQHTASISAGIAGSILPDFLVGIFELKIRRASWLSKFHKIHFYFHNVITNRGRDFSFRLGFIMQLIFLTLLQIRIF